MSGPPAESCKIVWWRGYMKGRFMALTREPRLIGQSPLIWWVRAAPPGPTEASVAALETLMEQLLGEEGWEIAEHGEEPWYEYVLRRPEEDRREPSTLGGKELLASQQRRRVVAFTANDEERALPPERPEKTTASPEPRAPQREHVVPESALEQLRSQVVDVRREARRERDRRLRAESELREAKKPRRAHPAPRARQTHPRSGALFVWYGLAVAVPASIFLVGFHSAYAAAVAALTATALALGVDSWLLARRRLRSPAEPPEKAPQR